MAVKEMPERILETVRRSVASRANEAVPEREGADGRAWSYSLRGLCRAVYRDYRRYRATGDGGWFTVIFLTQGFWACSVYRVSKYVLDRVKWTPLRRVVRVLLAVAQKAMEIVTGICIAPECRIGEGFYIGHYGGIFIHKDSPIGRNCNISQGVTIGVGGRGERRGVPKIGERVYIGPNAILFGDISIGDDAAIGAGAVVTKDVPPRGNVLGNPARIISMEGSFEFVQYDGMDTDPVRQESQSQAVSLIKEG
ncbi:MAG: serine O-acetyltransferase [Armatimonadetes bacterium]|nr:serine O-acetyltransferase [Armatimonadota bacterium]